MSGQKLQVLAGALEELERRQTENRLAYYKPYPKQREFHALGATKRERLLSAGNQQGKTWCGGMETAIHLTGEYPDWWDGWRFSGPIRGWSAGVTGEGTRDNPQRILLGPLGRQGTGSIPKSRILDVRIGRGVPDSVDTILVRHKSGKPSQLSFKSYEKGRERWQGETLDLIWLDEEPPVDIYSEALARISARRGLVFVTFTPLQGMSEVVRRFLNEPSADRAYVQMGIEHAEHIPESERQRIIDGFPPHEREARVYGIPMLGSGRVFPVPEAAVSEDPFPIPGYWSRICGIDFGWEHPTAAVWLAWDRETDVVHVYDAYRVRQETPIVHAAAIKARGGGDWIPIAWPHDGLGTEKGSGESLAELYRQQGLRMLAGPACHEDGGMSVEAGIQDMLIRMQTGRLKVFSHLADWFEEFRLYHRKDGRIVKDHDDLLAATRYALMMLSASRSHRRPQARIARDVDYDIFGG